MEKGKRYERNRARDKKRKVMGREGNIWRSHESKTEKNGK